MAGVELNSEERFNRADTAELSVIAVTPVADHRPKIGITEVGRVITPLVACSLKEY